VDDGTTQMVRLRGVGWLVETTLPPLGAARDNDDGAWAEIGNDVVGCAVQAARVHAERLAEGVNGTDLRKEREQAAERAREEAVRGRRVELEERRRREEG
jgi:hypothetical protein